MLQLAVEYSNEIRLGNINYQTEHELIAGCRQGEIAAFREIYTLHSTMLYSIAMRMLGVKEDAEDALQNCFAKLFKGISRFKGKSKLSSYMVRILINCCYDILSKRNRKYPTLEDTMIVDQNNELSLSLEKAIGLLPLKMRECFILFAVQGFKQNEISEMLQITEGAVKAHVFQAKKKLREILS